ncbi:FAD-binding oxidoreductase [Aureisphaera sp. CAU 1614]|uniref:FAD-binding oxidoreductase n=2 Tax=Halomarinibacterium sedimenti TaxID=2857106 RepID=A0A9X1FM64_9FLAO|nr:FAD-binding oxidoreductase [Halomarinibacterium sedimenti]
MDKIDYIIVGLGIAGISICEQLRKNNKSFVVIDANSSATSVAGGVVNPCVLKHFTPVWEANIFLPQALPFYKELESFLNVEFITETPILKVFNNNEEQNLWTVASDRNELSKYLGEEIIQNTNDGLNADFGFGKVNHSFQIDTKIIIAKYREYLGNTKSLLPTDFNFEALKVKNSEVVYEDILATNIVFAEGASAIYNPFFPKNILIPKKGEYITIKSPQLDCFSVLKSKFFIIPLGEDMYKIGATFAHDDYGLQISEKGRKELVAAIQKLITVPFEVIDQEVGMRPTVKDRRPLVGNLPEHKNVYFLNGLGTRGLLMAPLLSNYLYDFIENNINLPSEINIKRFFN